MGQKIFVTYKYNDKSVYSLPNTYFTRVRDYVDVLQTLLKKEDNINKGEADGQDLSSFKDDCIASKLRDKIYDSSLTIVMISKGMKNLSESEADQWMPWEIAYSLKEHTRDGRTSLTNAMLAVVIPDEIGSYDYFITENTICNSVTLHTNLIFQILRDNMFNIKQPTTRSCNGNIIYEGAYSYIETVKWDNFKANLNFYIDRAYKINENIEKYNIIKQIR